VSRRPVNAPAPEAATTMREALTDPALLGSVLRGDSWRAWRILLIAANGEALSRAGESRKSQIRRSPSRSDGLQS